MEALADVLDARDRIVVSTLSKRTLRWFRPPSHIQNVTLLTTKDVLSFTRWLQKYGAALERLDMCTNFTPFSNSFPAYLAGACPLLRSLTLDIPSHDIAALMLLSSRLEHLTFYLGGYVADEFSMKCLDFPKLKSLTLRHGESLRFVFPSSLPQLTHLVIEKCELDELPSMPCLRALELPRCITCLETIESLHHLTLLTKLDLSGQYMVFVPEVVGELVHLEELNLSHNIMSNDDDDGLVYDDIINALSLLPRLRDLDLSHNRLTNSALENLGVLSSTHLRHLNVSGNPCTMLPVGGYLKHITCLTTSFVPGCLEKIKCLEELHFHGNTAQRENSTVPTAPKSLHSVWLDDTEVIDVAVVHDIFRLVKCNPWLSVKRQCLS